MYNKKRLIILFSCLIAVIIVSLSMIDYSKPWTGLDCNEMLDLTYSEAHISMDIEMHNEFHAYYYEHCYFMDMDLSVWDETYVLIPPSDYEIKTDEVSYKSQYMISGASVSNISYNEDFNSLNLFMNSPERGILQILIPRGLLHLDTDPSFTYFVTANGKEIEFGEIGFEKLSPRFLKIPFVNGTERIEIISDAVRTR